MSEFLTWAGRDAVLLFYSLTVGAALGLFYDLTESARSLFTGKRRRYAPAEEMRIPLPGTAEETEALLRHGAVRSGKQRHAESTHAKSRPGRVSLSRCGVSRVIADLLFSLIAAIAVILLLFQLSDGKVRAFALTGAAVGAAVYFPTLGRPVRFLTEKAFLFVRKIVLAVLRHTIVPVSGRIAGLFRAVSLKRMKRAEQKARERAERRRNEAEKKRRAERARRLAECSVTAAGTRGGGTRAGGTDGAARFRNRVTGCKTGRRTETQIKIK